MMMWVVVGRCWLWWCRWVVGRRGEWDDDDGRLRRWCLRARARARGLGGRKMMVRRLGGFVAYCQVRRCGGRWVIRMMMQAMTADMTVMR